MGTNIEEMFLKELIRKYKKILKVQWKPYQAASLGETGGARPLDKGSCTLYIF